MNPAQPTPYPDQIYWGYDHFNLWTPSGFGEISQGYVPFNFTLYNLTSNTTYYAYIIGGSVHPGYPDLMDPFKIVRIKFKTRISPDGIYSSFLQRIDRFLIVLFFSCWK